MRSVSFETFVRTALTKLQTDVTMLKKDNKTLKQDVKTLKETSAASQRDIEILKYRVAYNHWQNIPKKNQKKKHEMPKNLKNQFLQICKNKCQITGCTYSAQEGNRQDAAIGHLIPQSSDILPQGIIHIHDFCNVVFLNKKLEEALDKRRLRFVKCPDRQCLVIDIVDPALKLQTFDQYNKISFGHFQGMPLDIRNHRPSFKIISEHARASAILAEEMGWDQQGNIVQSTYDNAMFRTSPTKNKIKAIKQFSCAREEQEQEGTFLYSFLGLSYSTQRFCHLSDTNHSSLGA